MAALAICLSVLLFVPLAYLIFRCTQVPAPDLKAFAQYALEPTDILPEPAEKLCFFSALLFFPLAIAGSVLVVNRFSEETLCSFGRVASVPIWLYLAALLFGSETVHLNSWYLKYTGLGLAFPYRLVAFALVFLAWKYGKPPGPRLTGLLLGAPLLALGLTCFLHANDPYVVHSHIMAVYYSVVQVYEGRILLYDFYNQYGLYPYFLLPLYRLVGLTMEIFSVSMGLLTVGCFAGIYFILRRLCRSQALALVGFLACLNFNYFYLKQIQCVLEIVPYLDQYFQYWPIRLLFPILTLLFLCRYFESGKRSYYLVGMLLFSAGCYWNLDSGVPAWGTWVLSLGYSEFLRPIPRRQSWRNALNHLMVAAACLLLVTGLIEIGLFLACSQWVPLSGMIQIHKVFYGVGFFMLPMELPHSWAMVALLYFAGLAWAFQAFRNGQDELRPKLVFALSILGIGCFSYFQGRSHDWVLLAVSWPATLLAIISIDELASGRTQRGPLAAATFWLLLTLVLNYALSLPLALKDVFPYVKPRLVGRPVLPEGHQLHEEIDYLEHRQSGYPKRMIILSNHSALLHQLTASQFLTFDSFCEMFRIDDWSRLAASIETENSPLIIVGFDFFRDDPKKAWRQLVIKALEGHYHRIEASPNRRLQIYAPNRGETYQPPPVDPEPPPPTPPPPPPPPV